MRVQKDDIVYFAHILPNLNVSEVLELQIRTIGVGWFVGASTTTNSVYAFKDSDVGKIIFAQQSEAAQAVTNARKEKEC